MWQKPSSFRQTIVKRKEKIRSGTLTRARLLKLYQISHILGTAFFSWQPLFSPHCRAGETPRRRHYAGGLYSQQQNLMHNFAAIDSYAPQNKNYKVKYQWPRLYLPLVEE